MKARQNEKVQTKQTTRKTYKTRFVGFCRGHKSK